MSQTILRALLTVALSLIALPAFAQTYAGSGFVESVEDTGTTGTVFDNTAGSTAFSDGNFPSTGLGVGDAVTYDVNCSRLGCIATNLVGSAPTPDLVISGSQNGSITVSAGELVHITGSVQHDVVVDGGTVVLFSGASVGRDLEITNGGHAEINDASIGRDLEGDHGTVDISSASVSRDIHFDFQGLGIYVAMRVGDTANGTAGAVTVGRDLDIDGDLDLEGSGALNIGRDLKANSDLSGWRWQSNDGAHVIGRDIVITSTDALNLRGDWCLFAGRDVYLRGDGSSGTVVNGEVHADTGDIFMSANGGSGSFSGPHAAAGSVEYDCFEACNLGPGTTTADDIVIQASFGLTENQPGGGLAVTSDRILSAVNNIDLSSNTTTSINGTLTAGDDVSVSSSADTVINGTVNADTGDITVSSGADATITGTVTALSGKADLAAGGTLTNAGTLRTEIGGEIQANVLLQSPRGTYDGGGQGTTTITAGSVELYSKLTDPGELLAAVTGGLVVAETPEGSPQTFEYQTLTLLGAAASGPMAACPPNGPICTFP